MIYHAGVHLRNRAFDAGFMSVDRLPRPVISVGNLTLGGTGKTPFVIYLAGILKEMGCETAVLTRGYGRCESGKTIVLSPGEGADFSASRLGDEPALIRRHLPEIWLGISSDRTHAAKIIVRNRECVLTTDRLVFVLDDGFQHRKIRRELDIVMINIEHPPDLERLLPLGALREPVTGLRRAQVVVINGTNASPAGNQNIKVDAITDNLRKYAPKADFFNCNRRIQAIVPFSDWLCSELPLTLSTPPAKAFLVAAIANPDRFKEDMQNLGVETRGCAFFRDHAEIGKKDWENCVGLARKVKAEAIVVTEKDAVKIYSPPGFPLFVAVQNMEISKEGRFREILQGKLKPRMDTN